MKECDLFPRIRVRSSPLPLMIAIIAAVGSPAVASAADKVQVKIWAIRATTSNSKISPELKSLAGKLKKDFKYTGYTLAKNTGGSIELKKSKRFSLTGPYSVVVMPIEKGSKMKLKLELHQKSGGKNKKRFGTTIKIARGKFQLLGRWSLGKGDVLILAVSAK